MTTNYVIGKEWTTIAEAGTGPEDNFILENVGTEEVFIAFGSTEAHHILRPNGTIIRAGVNGELKVRSQGNRQANIVISGV